MSRGVSRLMCVTELLAAFEYFPIFLIQATACRLSNVKRKQESDRAPSWADLLTNPLLMWPSLLQIGEIDDVRSQLYPSDVVIEQLFTSVYEKQQHKIQRHSDIAVLLQSFRRRTFYFSRKMRIVIRERDNEDESPIHIIIKRYANLFIMQIAGFSAAEWVGCCRRRITYPPHTHNMKKNRRREPHT